MQQFVINRPSYSSFRKQEINNMSEERDYLSKKKTIYLYKTIEKRLMDFIMTALFRIFFGHTL